MNLLKYEIFAETVKQKSLTLAARQLGCTQSAVSHSIDSLEKELGFPLLKRGRAGVSLTAEGEVLMPAVRTLLGSAEQLNQTASAIRGLQRIGSLGWQAGVPLAAMQGSSCPNTRSAPKSTSFT